ncbi:MAG: NADH-quinone oxidoreductase subunit M [Planctomycetes bacterium]|nr:NADH-quinone oxidoreductase subunit M [Planctomycetota bacterium]
MNVASNLLSWITFFPLVGILAIMCLPSAQKQLIRLVAIVASAVPLGLSLYMWFWGFDGASERMQLIERAPWIQAGNFVVQYFVGVDGLSMPLVALTCLLLFIGVFASWNIERGLKGYFALLLLLEIGINGTFVSLDMFLFYVFWEIMLLPMYFLIGIWGGPRREYAAIKFFLYTLAGSVLMLVAIVAIYIITGRFNIQSYLDVNGNNVAGLLELARTKNINPQVLTANGMLLGLPFQDWIFWFFFIAFAIKVPVFPFHTWLPDAHVEAPTPISVILAGILLKLGGYGMLRIGFPIAPESFMKYRDFLAVLGTINIVYGAYVAMGQTDFKKLVAYSSVSHMGYVLLGAASMTDMGLKGATLQMFNHGTSSAMLFLIVGVLYDRAHHRDLNGFGGLMTQMPRYGGWTTLGFFAALGLPGLAGFWSEAMTLLGSFGPYPTLTIISGLGVLMTAAFLLWTIQRVFLGPLNPKYAKLPDISAREIFCQAPFAALCIVFGVAPAMLINILAPAVKSYLAMFPGLH